MTRKSCKTNKNNAPDRKKTNSNETDEKDDINDIITETPLLVPSNKNSVNDNFLKTRLACKAEKNAPKMIIPYINIRCEPLNIEKIIDFDNNKVIVNEIHKSKKRPVKISRQVISLKTETLKSANKKKVINCDVNSAVKQMLEKNHLEPSEKKLEVNNCCDENVSDSSSDNSETNKKVKVSCSETQLTLQNKSLSDNYGYFQKSNVKQLNVQSSIPPDFKKGSSENLNIEGHSYWSSFAESNKFPPNELSDINLKQLPPPLEGITNEELKMKLTENVNQENKFTEVDTKNTEQKYPNNSAALNSNNQYDLEQINHIKKTSLQAAIEIFMKSPQLNYLKENTALKKGLCSTWLSNNYVCANQQCTYSHNALNLFTMKLKQYPSKFIMTVVVSMRNDTLFVDVIMAAFKILSERKIPMFWITFLVYFVFYVTEPSDTKFLKFWSNSARFFCQSKYNYAAANGFASLLSIFSQEEKSEEWKIIEFIKLIKQPPVQISINYALLQPVLKMDLPSEFLTEAIESSIATRKDVSKVFKVIIPKISFMTSPIKVVELLLQFCQTLEEMNLKDYSDELKQQLRAKVRSFKMKITQSEYPLTASFQEEINTNSQESNCFTNSGNSPERLPEMDLETLEDETDYFKLKDDFCELMTEQMELSFDTVPNSVKLNKSGNAAENKGDVCEQQITRIRQFFHNSQFNLLGNYLNELKSDMIEGVAKEFLKLLFKMKISLQQVVDLTKIIILPCKSESATKIIASVSITLILNLVRINEWEKSYTIVSLCQEKKINLLEGKVFYLSENNMVTQCRIALLLIEIYTYNKNYQSALNLVEIYNLYSSDNSLWKLTWKTCDEAVRIRILEDVLQQTISNQATEKAYDLFRMIYEDQNQLLEPVDLRKCVNEILIFLLNQDSERAINLYRSIKTEVELNDITIRAILITLTRLNHLSEAKNLLHLPNQKEYFLPEVTTLSSINISISSFWLEEEIYVIFDEFFDSLIAKKGDFIAEDFDNLDIQIEISMHKKTACSSLRPLCLGIIKPTFEDACARIERVLKYRFNPPLELVISPYHLQLEEYTTKRHLYNRMSRHSS